MYKKEKGIDWSKKCMYEGIGRPDLKPEGHNKNNSWCSCENCMLNVEDYIERQAGI